MKTTMEALMLLVGSLTWGVVGFFIPAFILGPMGALLATFADHATLIMGCQMIVYLITLTGPLIAIYFLVSGLRGNLPLTRIRWA